MLLGGLFPHPPKPYDVLIVHNPNYLRKLGRIIALFGKRSVSFLEGNFLYDALVSRFLQYERPKNIRSSCRNCRCMGQKSDNESFICVSQNNKTMHATLVMCPKGHSNWNPLVCLLVLSPLLLPQQLLSRCHEFSGFLLMLGRQREFLSWIDLSKFDNVCQEFSLLSWELQRFSSRLRRPDINFCQVKGKKRILFPPPTNQHGKAEHPDPLKIANLSKQMNSFWIG